VLYRVNEAKRAETRAKRIEKFVAMLHAQETIHPRPATKATGARKSAVPVDSAASPESDEPEE
jgi:hypothetical protein